MSQTRRERLRLSTLEEIKATAWKQAAEQGAAALSLRAIAREMGMTAPGLYRYYRDRDALVTGLLIDAFDSFSVALEEARDGCPKNDHAGRFRAICRSYFQWGITSPQKYQFLFGTPIPRYQLSGEVGPAAQRSFLVLQGVIGEAYAAGRIREKVKSPRMKAGLKTQYNLLRTLGMPYPVHVTHLALSTWSTMHGITSLCLYGYFSGFLGEQVSNFLEMEIERMIRSIGIV